MIIFYHSDHFVKVFSHNTEGGLFTSSQDALSRNQDNPQASLFSILGKLESYRNAEGKFRFKICYPEVQSEFHGLGHCNEWLQSSNPTTEGTITGYKRIHLAFPKNGAGRAWGGLGRSGNSGTLADDTGSSLYWWMAVGATEYYHPNKKTIPGPWARPADGIKKIELYVNPEREWLIFPL